MITCYDIVKALVRSEKGTALEKERKYLFRVATMRHQGGCQARRRGDL